MQYTDTNTIKDYHCKPLEIFYSVIINNESFNFGKKFDEAELFFIDRRDNGKFNMLSLIKNSDYGNVKSTISTITRYTI